MPLAINTYNEYGINGAALLGRFGYTGQKWIPGLGMYDYKARIYSPTLGRFMQTDPTGYGDGMNMYAYVGEDPVNNGDPSGMFRVPPRLADGGNEEVTRFHRGAGVRTVASLQGAFATRVNGRIDSNNLTQQTKQQQQPTGLNSNGILQRDGGPLSSEYVACLLCHGIATDADRRYTTSQENSFLQSIVETVFTLIPAMGPTYRATRTMSTGRTYALGLSEGLLMSQAKAYPSLGTNLRLKLGDPRLPTGSIKLEQRGSNATVHYVKLPNGVYVDYKFVP